MSIEDREETDITDDCSFYQPTVGAVPSTNNLLSELQEVKQITATGKPVVLTVGK